MDGYGKHPSYKRSLRLYANSKNKTVGKVGKYSFYNEWKWKWDLESRRELFEWEINQLMILKQELSLRILNRVGWWQHTKQCHQINIYKIKRFDYRGKKHTIWPILED